MSYLLLITGISTAASLVIQSHIHGLVEHASERLSSTRNRHLARSWANLGSAVNLANPSTTEQSNFLKALTMAKQAVSSERLTEITLSSFSSPEPENQRGRKRGRSPATIFKVETVQIPSGGSATFRGRSRHRSTSRLDASSNTSRLRDGSLSPTKKRLLRVVRLNRHRSQSPSRSRSPNGQDTPKRRRQRTRSRSRDHQQASKLSEKASFLRHEIVIRNDGAAMKEKQSG